MIAVEVLSPGNRNEDTVCKSTDYLAAGVRQFWIVDPTNRILEVFENASAGWDILATLNDAIPTATVAVPGFGSVDVDLTYLFGS